MPRQIAAYQAQNPLDLEARVHTLELQVAYLTEAVRSLTARASEPGAAAPAD